VQAVNGWQRSRGKPRPKGNRYIERFHLNLKKEEV
jgi:hypothetical protein